ncbi:regulatory protein RecX [Saccharophagus sp. K07]|nr:regulatory protein RecX [Saccharophagus sp. K07]
MICPPSNLCIPVNDQDPVKQIYNFALGLLSRREHSHHELQQKLLQRFSSHAESIEQVLAQLADQGYQSDERYADAYIRGRRSKGYGDKRIAQELRLRGIESGLIEKTLSEHSVDEHQDRSLFHVWNKKFKTPPQDLREKSRQISFLRYRGFSMSEIERLFEQIAQDH